MQIIGPAIGRAPLVAEIAEIAAPGAEGEARLRYLDGIEYARGEWSRAEPGWYVEVFVGGEWRRRGNPYPLSLSGAPPQEAIDAALKMAAG